MDGLDSSNNGDSPLAIPVADRIFVFSIGSPMMGWSRVYAFRNMDAATQTMEWYIQYAGWTNMTEDRSRGNVKGFTDRETGDWASVSNVPVGERAVTSMAGGIRI